MQATKLEEPRGVRPFLKWAGGKARLVPKLLQSLPPDADELRHVEPFVGGGALFFARCPARALLADVNKNLMEAYREVQVDLPSVIGGLSVLAEGHGLVHYESVRDLYNEGCMPSSTRAAMLIYLNKTCFNGLYRVNKRGAFNVPIGVFKSPPKILDREVLVAASRALRGIRLETSDFRETLEMCGEGDFVYLDPPYVPTSKTSNFTAYTEDGFTEEQQCALARAVVSASKRGARILLSQSDTELTRRLYDRRFQVEEVQNTRSLSATMDVRGPVSELLIRNY